MLSSLSVRRVKSVKGFERVDAWAVVPEGARRGWGLSWISFEAQKVDRKGCW